MDQRGPRIESESSREPGDGRVEYELELSTGFAVGFCYHKAADLRVCQAAHSLSCVRPCSALLQSVQTVHFEILNKRLTVPLRVWSLTVNSTR